MAHYVISDIHGESDRFHEMLEKIHFSDSDTLYIIGDVVDRGPHGITLLQEVMATPNMVMMLGNHEYMMLQYMHPDATDIDFRRWNKNGNAPTLEEYNRLTEQEQQVILDFLKGLPTHIELTVNGTNFYLIHGFPGVNVHDEVWNRPTMDSPNPIPGSRVIVGLTPVRSLTVPKEEREAFTADMVARGEHIRIYHCEGFIDIDCGCGHEYPINALSCLRLEDMEEFYT